jgi:hypothetical protein
MVLDCVSLKLTPPGCNETVILVRTTDALRLCREGGYEEMPAQQAELSSNGLVRRDMDALRDFVARAQLSRFPLSSLDDSELLALIRDSIKGKDVVILREGEGGEGESDATVELRRLIKQIEHKTQGKLSYLGRRYKLVADADLKRVPNRDSYEVAKNEDARKVLDGIAGQSDTPNDLVALLVKARNKLTRDWRPPLHPDGLILLRKIIGYGASSNLTDEILTPSQIKKRHAKTEWIEIEVFDELGKPYTGRYRIELPDGSFADGNFDDQGLWGNYDIEPGKCKMLLPDVPEAVKPGTMEPPPTDEELTWIAIKLVDDEGKAIVGRPYRLQLVDGSERKGQSGEGEVRADDIKPGTCIYTLYRDADAAGAAAASDVISTDDEVPSDTEVIPAAVVADEAKADDTVPTPGILDVIVQDGEGNPIANTDFEAYFSDGTMKPGTTDASGKLHLEDCPGDSCTLIFPETK